MELNTAMRFVMNRAEAERASLNSDFLLPAHVFLGLLKLAVSSADDFAPESKHKAQTDADIQVVRLLLAEAGLDAQFAREMLRVYVAAEAGTGTDANEPTDRHCGLDPQSPDWGEPTVTDIARVAADKAADAGAEAICASHYLEALLERPDAASARLLADIGGQSYEHA
jgi:hypothetical protein